MKVNKSICFLSLFNILFSLGLDQWTKWAIVQAIPLYEKLIVIPHFFSLTYVRNYGAGFSIMEGYGVFFFSIVTVLALIAILYYFLTCNDRRIQICLSFVSAGALGNWVDRIRFGYVRDFFSFRLFGQGFPVFNIADICITMGFFCIILILIGDDWKEKLKWKQKNG